MPIQGIGCVVRTTLGVSLAVALVGIANGGLFALIGVHLPADGASDTTVGFVTSSYFLGTLTASLTCGPLVARLNHVRAFAFFAVLAGFSTLALATVSPGGAWSALRYLTGCGIGGYYIVVESWYNHATGNAGRGRSLAFYETVRLSSVALGSVVFLNITGLAQGEIIAGAGLLYLAAISPVIANRHRRPPTLRAARTRFRSMVAREPLGVWCCVVGGLVTGAIYGLVPLYGAKVGMMSDEISLFVFANHAAAFLVQYPAGALSDRYGRLAVIAAMTLAGAAVALAVALTELQDFWLLLAASVAVGGVAHSLHTAGAVHANDRLSPDLYVAGAATLLVAYDIGTSLGPLAASYAMARLGPPGLYWFIALLVGSVGALALANLAVRLPGGQRFTGGG